MEELPPAAKEYGFFTGRDNGTRGPYFWYACNLQHGQTSTSARNSAR